MTAPRASRLGTPPRPRARMPALAGEHRPLERRSAVRTAVVWDALQQVLGAPGAAGSSTSAAAPAGSRSGSPSSATRSPSSTPAPTPSPRSAGGPPRAASPTWSPASRATWPGCPTWSPTRQRRRGALPRRPRDRRRPRRGAGRDRRGAPPRRHAQPAGRPAARRGRRPGDGRPLPARPSPLLDGTDADASAGERRFTADGGHRAAHRRRLHRRGGARRPGLRRPGPQLAGRPRARCRAPPCSTSSAPSPTAPSTSPSPPSCTSSPRAERRRSNSQVSMFRALPGACMPLEAPENTGEVLRGAREFLDPWEFSP